MRLKSICGNRALTFRIILLVFIQLHNLVNSQQQDHTVMTISARLRPEVTLPKIEKLLLDGPIRPITFEQLQHSYLFTGEQIQLNQLRAALETQFGKGAILKWENQHENITVGAPNHTALSEYQAHLIVNINARLRSDISGDKISQFLEKIHPAHDVSFT